MRTVAESIKIARTLAGYTQAGLSCALGMNQQAVSQWEQGRRTPRLPTLRKIAEATGVTVGWLMGEGS